MTTTRPTAAKRTGKYHTELREQPVPGFVEGTESAYPARTERRRLLRDLKHKRALALAKLGRN